MPIYSNMPDDFYPRPSDINAPLRSTIGRGPRGPKGHSITAKVIDTDPYGYFRVQFIDADTDEVLVTTPNLDVGSRFYVCNKLFEDVSVGSSQSAVVMDFSTLQASSDCGAIRVGDLVFFTTRMSDETFLTLDTIGIGVVNTINGTQVNFITTNVMSARVADGGITTEMIADLAVTTAKIANAAVTSNKIANSAVDTAQLNASAVTTDKIADGAVMTAKIADEAVTNGKIGTNAVTTAKIADGNVSTNKLANASVTTDKIAQSAVTSDRIDDGSISTAKLANGSVTNTKLSDGAVTDAKLAQSGGILERTTALTAEIGTFENGDTQLLNGGMVTGSINADGTIDENIRYRAYTPILQHYNRDILLHFTAPATGFFLCIYDDSDNIISRTSYGVDVTIQENTYFRICAFGETNIAANELYKSFTFSSILKSFSDNLSNIKSWEDFKQYALCNGIALFSGKYVNGSVTATGELDTTLTFRVTTNDIIHSENDITVQVNTDWQVWLTTYQQDGTFIQRENKREGTFVIPENTYFRITIGKINEVPGRANIEEFALNAYATIKTYPINREWVAIGDSLTEINETATKRYCDYVSENLNLSLINMGVGGTGYKNGSDNSLAFYQRVQNAPSDADVYTIFGSGNDGASTLNNFPIGEPDDSGTNTLCGCINTTIDNLYNRNPSAIIGLITPTPWAIWPPYGSENDSATLPNQDPAWMQKYSNAIVSVCKRRGIPVLDLYSCSAMRPWDETFRTLFYSRDGNNGVHPDENGHRLFIAPHVQEFVKTLIQFP